MKYIFNGLFSLLCLSANAEIIELQMNQKMAKSLGTILIEQYQMKASDLLIRNEREICETPTHTLIRLCANNGKIIRKKANGKLANDLNHFLTKWGKNDD